MSESEIKLLKARKRSIRQQMRDARRLLAKKDLPETVRETKSRVLNMLLEEDKKRKKDQKERNMNKKYKMVKFFEKRKISRRLKPLLEEIASGSLDSNEKQVQQLRADLNYVLHYPTTEKYYSLFPTTASNKHTLSRRAAIYQKILTEVKDGILEDGLASICSPDVMSRLPVIDTTMLPVNEDIDISVGEEMRDFLHGCNEKRTKQVDNAAITSVASKTEPQQSVQQLDDMSVGAVCEGQPVAMGKKSKKLSKRAKRRRSKKRKETQDHSSTTSELVTKKPDKAVQL